MTRLPLLIVAFFIFSCASTQQEKTQWKDADFYNDRDPGKLTDVEKAIVDLKERMTLLERKIEFFAKESEITFQPIRRSQADLEARMDKLQTNMQNLLGQFEESKYFFQKAYGEVKPQRESSQAKYDELVKNMMALNKAVEDLGKKVEYGGKKIDNWDKNVENWRKKVDDWGKKVEDLGKKVEYEGKKTENWDKNVEDWGKKVGEWGKTVEDWGRKVEYEAKKTENWERSVEEWRKKVEEWGKKVDDWGKKVEDFGKKVDQLEHSIKSPK